MTIVQEKLFNIPFDDISKLCTKAESSVKELFFEGKVNCDLIRKLSFSQNKNLFIFDKLNVNNFSSIELKTAIDEYPLIIVFGFFEMNQYISTISLNDKTPCIIHFGFNRNRLKQLKTEIMQKDIYGEVSLNYFSKDLHTVFTTERLISGLTHELTHYLDDYFHNQAIAKSLLRRTFFKRTEVNAYIHAIEKLKIKHAGQWDMFTIYDVLAKDEFLKGYYKMVYAKLGSDEAKSWVKELLKRMNRENLIGKNMKNIQLDNFLLESIVTI